MLGSLSKNSFKKLTLGNGILFSLGVVTFLSIGLLFNPVKDSKNNSIFNPFSAKPTEVTRKVALGFWTEGLWNSTEQKVDASKLKEVEAKIGKKVAIANYFRGWVELTHESFLTELATISENGWIPMVSANPYYADECIDEGFTLYKEIAIGSCDAILHKIAKNLSKYKDPYFIRFAWEMNVDTIDWSTLKTGSTPHEFIDAWRRFHDIMRQEGATSAIWVFSPQIDTPTTQDFYELYPGDEYVDWVGLDGYNWGLTQSWSGWQEFDKAYFSSYKRMVALAPSKKFMIAEINSTDVGGDKAEWYRIMLINDIHKNYPEIEAIVFFNENKSVS